MPCCSGCLSRLADCVQLFLLVLAPALLTHSIQLSCVLLEFSVSKDDTFTIELFNHRRPPQTSTNRTDVDITLRLKDSLLHSLEDGSLQKAATRAKGLCATDKEGKEKLRSLTVLCPSLTRLLGRDANSATEHLFCSQNSIERASPPELPCAVRGDR